MPEIFGGHPDGETRSTICCESPPLRSSSNGGACRPYLKQRIRARGRSVLSRSLHLGDFSVQASRFEFLVESVKCGWHNFHFVRRGGMTKPTLENCAVYFHPARGRSGWRNVQRKVSPHWQDSNTCPTDRLSRYFIIASLPFHRRVTRQNHHP